MRFRRRLLPAALCGYLLSPFVPAGWAQDQRPVDFGSPPPSFQAFRDTIRVAMERHPQVRAAQSRVEAAQHGLSASKWGRYPSLSAEMSRNDNGDTLRRVQVQQPLWAGGRIDADIDLSNSRVGVASESLKEAEFALAEQMVLAAVELAKTRVQLARARESLEAYQKLLSAIERRADGGLGLQSDVTLARSRIEQARAIAAQFEANERRANLRWMALTGQPSTGLAVPEQTPADTGTLQELQDEAKAFSPTIARLKAEAEAAGFDADVTKAVIWPQLSLRAVRSWQTGITNQTETQYLGVLEYQPGAGIGVVDRARAAYSQRDAALAQIDKAVRDLEEQVGAAHADRAGFSARVQALQSASAANAEVIDSFMRQYNIGKRTWLDVLNAQREWTESIQSGEDTKYSALAASYRLAVLSGRFFRP